MAFLIGILLRLCWPQDMEYFSDQQGIFRFALAPFWNPEKDWIDNGLGISASSGLMSPGLTFWIFQIPAHLFGMSSPPELAIYVRSLNIAALAVFLFFALRIVAEKERDVWLWAWLMMLVNPFEVFFQRRIWPPSVLYLFVAFFLIGWWRRERPWASFLWGVMGALMSQLHLLGALFCAAFLLWSVMNRKQKNVARWWPFILGSALGLIPAIPWFAYLAKVIPSGSAPLGERVWEVAYQMRFWRYWFTQPFGFWLTYFLEPGGYFREFMAYPFIGRIPTYLVGLLHAGIAVLGLATIALYLRSGWRLFRESRRARSPHPILDSFWGRGSSTDAAIHAAQWGYGGLVLSKTFYVFRHYLIISGILSLAWLARTVLREWPERWRHKVLAALWLLQLGITIFLLIFLHDNGGAPGAEYGHSYRWQREHGVWTQQNDPSYHRDTYHPVRKRPEDELYNPLN